MKRVRAFITGIGGFVGRHLSRHLLAGGHEVSGVDHRSGAGSGVTHADISIVELADRDALAEALLIAQPDWVFHLAATTKASDPLEFYRNNVVNTASLFEALRQAEQRPAVIVSSSSAVYGDVDGDDLIPETLPARPISPYGASKLAQEVTAMQYQAAGDFRVTCTRTFNLVGPDLPPRYACSAFARRIAKAEASGGGEIDTGQLDAERDFTDVRDAVRAYVLIAAKGEGGQVYNVCSERAMSIRSCLDTLLVEARAPVSATARSELLQEHDVSRQAGSAHKVRQVTGWVPEIPLEQALKELLDYWRNEEHEDGLEE